MTFTPPTSAPGHRPWSSLRGRSRAASARRDHHPLRRHAQARTHQLGRQLHRGRRDQPVGRTRRHAPAARLKTLQGARYAEKDAAANRGTQVHALAEELVAGKAVQAPDEIAGHVEAYARFLDEFQVAPVDVEFSVASYRHG